MKFSAITLVIILWFCSVTWADESNQPLQNQKDKESYSIGYQVGLSMQADGVEVNFDKLSMGLQDAIQKNEPLLSMDEMKSLIVALKTKAREIQLKKQQEAIVKNKEEADRFLAENGKKEGVITTASGLEYQVLKEGNGVSPKPEDMVKVNYRGTFIDGTEFDSSYKRGTPLVIQTDGVIKGWTEALQAMKVGAKWKVFVPPDLGYGRGGLGGKIPPNKVLVFEIELLGIESAGNQGNG